MLEIFILRIGYQAAAENHVAYVPDTMAAKLACVYSLAVRIVASRRLRGVTEGVTNIRIASRELFSHPMKCSTIG